MDSSEGPHLIAIGKAVLCEHLKWFNFDIKLIEKILFGTNIDPC